MEVDQVEERQLVNGGLMKNYIGKTVQIWLNTTDNTTGGRQVRNKFHNFSQFASFLVLVSRNDNG